MINKFVQYNEMQYYLSAADIGFIWREKSVINEIASPVKFSEFLCCGLPVIANRNVTMISEFLPKHDVGLLVNNLNQIVKISFKI